VETDFSQRFTLYIYYIYITAQQTDIIIFTISYKILNVFNFVILRKIW